MMNPYEIIKRTQTAPLQEEVGKKISTKKAGRPKKPNMGKYLIKMDKILHKKLMNRAEEMGCSRSFIISQALRSHLN